MNATLAEVPIKSAHIVVTVEELSQVTQVNADMFWRHSRIFPTFPILGFARNVSRCAQSRLTHMPDAFLFLDVIEKLHRWSVRLFAEVAHQLPSFGVALGFRRAAKFNEQKSVALREQSDVIELQMFLL